MRARKVTTGRSRRRRLGMLIGAAVALMPTVGRAQGDLRNLIPEVRLDQDDINAGAIPFATIFNAGKHIFSNRFTTEDHMGEAPDGPRRRFQSLAGRPNLPFIRFNGLDSQSCLECHNVAGFAPPAPAIAPMRFMKEPGISGGGAGSASNAFGFDRFPTSTVGFVRNPPHAFGSGYAQRLAEEMTEDLLAIRDAATEQALKSGTQVSVDLIAKGVSFGRLAVLANGQVSPIQPELEGVSEDLVIRPFQFKGLASTMRNFVGGALNFHFSVQPKELLDRGVIPNDNPNGTLLGDELNEILEGEVSAIALFTAFLRPPTEVTDGLDPAAVDRGREIFVQADCVSCHQPTLRIEDPRMTVIDPRPLLAGIAARKAAGVVDPPTPESPTLTNGEKSSEDLPVVRQYRLNGIQRKQVTVFTKVSGASPPDRLPGFTRSLNEADGPPESLPRLPFNESDGSIVVPLYSDLKRHKMGDGLAETFDQGVDVGGLTVAGDEWLTRPLWGVADTPPWMHDGRALTLREAILMHEGAGSEANPSIGLYKALSVDDREALRSFLMSLRLPTLGLGPTNAASFWKDYDGSGG